MLSELYSKFFQKAENPLKFLCQLSDLFHESWRWRKADLTRHIASTHASRSADKELENPVLEVVKEDLQTMALVSSDMNWVGTGQCQTITSTEGGWT
jgi:hypothetical protein